MTVEKKYPVTDEIAELFAEGNAAEECKIKAINSIWGTKRAIAYGKVQWLKRNKAWSLIFKLYPELESKALSFYPYTQEVKLKDIE